MKAAVFIERDGILARSTTAGGGTATRLEDFQVIESAAESLKALRDAGFLIYATTNQPGVTSGAPTRRELDLMHSVMVRKLALSGVLVCPHPLDDACPCRKPQPGLLRDAASTSGIDLEHSFVVSGHWSDAEMAETVGSTSVLIRSEQNGHGHHDLVVTDLKGAVAKILEVAQGMGTLRVLAASRR